MQQDRREGAKRIHVSLTAAVHRRLNHASEELGIPASNILALALAEFLERRGLEQRSAVCV